MWKEIILWIFLAYHSIYDIKTRKINIIVCILFGVVGLVMFDMSSSRNVLSLAGGILTGVYLLVFSYLTKEAIGIGDGFVVTAVGIWMGGGKTLAALMGGFVLAAGFGILRICAGKANGKTELAFVPFFALSYGLLSVGRIV